MRAGIRIELNNKLFLRDPDQTDLGRSIIKESISLIDELGFEHFTFKKLAQQINSTEASVYRYFENKHKLLLYLVSWYWNWLAYRVGYHTHNVADAEEKLRIFIKILANDQTNESLSSYVDVEGLARIIMVEASKAYLTKDVDIDNKAGLFQDYKHLCHKMAEVVLQINPAYPYPHALISTLFEVARKQWFFAQHLPSLTEVSITRPQLEISLSQFLNHITFAAIKGDYISTTTKG